MPASTPKYCITIDTDWATEHALAHTLELIIGNGIKPTVFATNESSTLSKYLEEDKIEIGLHPNFLPGSTHGSEYLDVIRHIENIFPQAKCFRAHAYFDNSLISREFYKRGFKYDANLCLNMQEGIVPLQHESGLLRFPTFLEDGVFLYYNGQICISKQTERLLKSDGLKIFTFHPTSVFANSFSFETYEKAKQDAKKNTEFQDVKEVNFGARSLLKQLIRVVSDSGEEFYPLNKFNDFYHNS